MLSARFLQRSEASPCRSLKWRVIDEVFLEGGGGGPNNGLYGEAPPERGTFQRLQVYESVRILLVEVYERVGTSVI